VRVKPFADFSNESKPTTTMSAIGTPHAATRRAEFWAGVRGAFPVIVGATPFAVIFGALAVTSGLLPLTAAALSLLVFAGSAQFIAVGLVASGTGVALIIATTLVVNLRHLLYGATLAPYVRRLSQPWLALLGFTLTDEAFVTSISRYNQPDVSPYKHWYFFGAAIGLYVNWQFWTLVGIVAGQAAPAEQIARLGLDFAATATFIGMIIPLARGRAGLAAALSAAMASLVFYNLPGRLGLMVAALVGVGVGVAVERRGGQAAERSDERA
jgi:4-azaleucine resistance transporter AzlC